MNGYIGLFSYLLLKLDNFRIMIDDVVRLGVESEMQWENWCLICRG